MSATMLLLLALLSPATEAGLAEAEEEVGIIPLWFVFVAAVVVVGVARNDAMELVVLVSEAIWELGDWRPGTGMPAVWDK